MTPRPDPAGRRRPALPPAVAAPAPPVVLFSDEMSAVTRTTRIPEWLRTTRSPLQTLTWIAPPTPYEEP
ncbi:hypothetical protein [Streptomyces sp. NPDC002746]